MADIDDLFSAEALNSISKVQVAFASIITQLDQFVSKVQGLDQLIAALNKSTMSQDALNKMVQQEIDLNNKLKDTEDKIIDTHIKLQKENKELLNDKKNDAILNDSEAGTLEKLTAANSKLRQEKKALNLETAEGTKRLKEINAELDKNNAFIKENADGLTKLKLGIGGYANGIKDAMLQMVSFGGAGAIVMKVFDGLKDAVMSTTGAINFFNIQGALWKQLMYDIVTTGSSSQAAMEKVAEATDKLNKGRVESAMNSGKIAKLDREEAELREDAADKTKTHSDRLDILNKVKDIAHQKTQIEVEDLRSELDAQKEILDQRPKDEKQRLIVIDLINKINAAYGNEAREMRRVEAQRTQFEEEESQRVKKQYDDLMKLADEQIKSDQEKADKEAKIAQENINEIQKYNETFLQTEFDEKVKEEKKADDFAEEQRKLLGVKEETLGLQHNKDVEKQLAEQLKLVKKEAEEEEKIEKEKSKLTKQLLTEGYQLGKEIEEDIINNKIAKLEKAKEVELSNTALTAEQKSAINKEYAKKEADLKRKAAEVEKVEGLFKIAIETAKNVTSESNPEMMYMIPWTIAQGVMEAALVAAKPIPAYSKGTRSAKGGTSIVGERGRELMIDPSGKIALSGESAELINLRQGTKIIPSEETKRIMAVAAMSERNTIEATIDRGNREIVRAIRNKKEFIFNVGVGHHITERQGNTYKRYFERHLQ